ncbi:MAG: SPOR domain-containing protein [Candidatus Gastranaerophilales bacterium]|nr:SPOR domain-containing protein [Candidatus Gastranaerophilales bacterium]
MNFNSSGYFAYKKNKIQREIEEQKKPISRVSFLLQLFVATFIIIFIIFAVSFMKFSSKMDIEYTKGELQFNPNNMTSIPNYSVASDEEPQRKIDKRLLLIQQEENAPSEARIIEKNKNPEVISRAHLENNKKIEKLEKQKKLNAQIEEKQNKISNIIEEVKFQKKIPTEQISVDNNVTIISKVLIGRYNTFEEAQKLQLQIKAKNHKLQPFVRKVGNVYSVQMGSYQDFDVAKSHAHVLRNQGFDVWIYQQ